jgi:hypothetical protein
MIWNKAENTRDEMRLIRTCRGTQAIWLSSALVSSLCGTLPKTFRKKKTCRKRNTHHMFISSPSKSALYGGVLKFQFNTPVIGIHSM